MKVNKNILPGSYHARQLIKIIYHKFNCGQVVGKGVFPSQYNTTIQLRFYLKNYSFLGINSFVTVDQHKICQLTMYNLTTFHEIKNFPMGARPKFSILDLPIFQKMPKGHRATLIGFAIWRFSRAQFIKKFQIMQKIPVWLLDQQVR